MRLLSIVLFYIVVCSHGQLLNTDSVTTDTPEKEPPIVSAVGVFNNDTVTIGDTVTFTVSLSYTKALHPLLFQPDEGAQFHNLEVTAVTVDQKKVYSLLGYKNVTTYVYTLVTQGPGGAGNNEYSYTYLHLGDKLSVEIPAKNIEVLPRRDKTVTLYVGAFIILLIMSGVGIILKKRKQLRERQHETGEDYGSMITQLKKRVKKADSAAILKEVDRIAREWISNQLQGEEFASLKEHYTAYNMSKELASEEKEAWEHLVKESDHLRFGGGKREEFELMETVRILSICVGTKEEEE